MIIQNPDGTYELCCPQAPVAARWWRALLRVAQGDPRARPGGAPAEAPACCGPCPGDGGAAIGA